MCVCVCVCVCVCGVSTLSNPSFSVPIHVPCLVTPSWWPLPYSTFLVSPSLGPPPGVPCPTLPSWCPPPRVPLLVAPTLLSPPGVPLLGSPSRCPLPYSPLLVSPSLGPPRGVPYPTLPSWCPPPRIPLLVSPLLLSPSCCSLSWIYSNLSVCPLPWIHVHLCCWNTIFIPWVLLVHIEYIMIDIESQNLWCRWICSIMLILNPFNGGWPQCFNPIMWQECRNPSLLFLHNQGFLVPLSDSCGWVGGEITTVTLPPVLLMYIQSGLHVNKWVKSEWRPL